MRSRLRRMPPMEMGLLKPREKEVESEDEILWVFIIFTHSSQHPKTLGPESKENLRDRASERYMNREALSLNISSVLISWRADGRWQTVTVLCPKICFIILLQGTASKSQEPQCYISHSFSQDDHSSDNYTSLSMRSAILCGHSCFISLMHLRTNLLL